MRLNFSGWLLHLAAFTQATRLEVTEVKPRICLGQTHRQTLLLKTASAIDQSHSAQLRDRYYRACFPTFAGFYQASIESESLLSHELKLSLNPSPRNTTEAAF